jgi:hypothetical protein
MRPTISKIARRLLGWGQSRRCPTEQAPRWLNPDPLPAPCLSFAKSSAGGQVVDLSALIRTQSNR